MTTSTRHISAALAIFAMVAALSGATARADDAAANDPTNATALPSELRDAGIEANLGGQLPVDVTLVDHDGRQVRFGDYLSDGKPALVVFAYYACPMLCTLVLNGALESFKALPWRVGDQFRVVTISIDERDTPAIAKEKRTNYLRQLGWPVGDRGWDFLTGRAEDVRRLADAAGFHYRWDAAQQQFAHAAGLFVLTPTGIVSRVLYGISFDEKDLRLALTEASGGKIATLTERILLFCFHYEPKTGKYVVAAQQAMKLGGFFTMAVLALVVAYYRRHEKRMRPLDAALRPSVQA